MLGETKAHHDTRYNQESKDLTKINRILKRTWAIALKKSPKAEVNPKAKQRNHHLPVDHGCSSHLLTSTSWWSSQNRVPHSRTHNNNRRV